MAIDGDKISLLDPMAGVDSADDDLSVEIDVSAGSTGTKKMSWTERMVAIIARLGTAATKNTGTGATHVILGNDARLTDNRTAGVHAASHKSAGSDSIKLDELAASTDVTTLNASNTKHGLLLKLIDDVTKYLRSDGTWEVPVALEAFKIGAIYINVTGVNAGTELGYGTWSAFGAGRTLVGYSAGDPDFGTGEGTCGEKTHALDATEIPSHSHDVDIGDATVTETAHTHSFTSTPPVIYNSLAGDGYAERNGTATPEYSFTVTPTTLLAWYTDPVISISSVSTGITVTGVLTSTSIGSSGAHNNIQPSITVYFWKRTA